MGYTTGAEQYRYYRKTVEQVIDKVHIIKDSGKGGLLTFPMCMIGKRVRLVLVEEQEVEDD